MKIRITPALLLFMLCGCVLAASGCVTHTFHAKRKENSRPQLEFRSFENKDNVIRYSDKKLYHGRYGGLVSTNGNSYHEVQFDGILDGKDRYLTARLPARFPGPPDPDNPFEVSLLETTKPLAGPPNAYLVNSYSSPFEEELSDFRDRIRKGGAPDPYKWLEDRFGYRAKEKTYPVVIAVFDKPTYQYYEFSFHYFVWEKGPGMPRVIAYGWNKLNYEECLKDIRWVKRSRALYTAGLLVYPLCVIADIATLPALIVFFPVYISALQNLKS